MILILEGVPRGMVMRWYWLRNLCKVFTPAIQHLCTILRALSTNHSFHFCQIFFLSQPCLFLPRLSLAKNPESLSHFLLIIHPLMNSNNSWLKPTTIIPPLNHFLLHHIQMSLISFTDMSVPSSRNTSFGRQALSRRGHWWCLEVALVWLESQRLRELVGTTFWWGWRIWGLLRVM